MAHNNPKRYYYLHLKLREVNVYKVVLENRSGTQTPNVLILINICVTNLSSTIQVRVIDLLIS